MASEALVDVSYRGLVLGKRVRLLQVGPQSAYVAHDAPMPVGTELVLTVDESLSIPVQVARVREGDSKDGPAGMWLWADAAEQRARAWWDEHVTAEDPRIPEPAGGRVRTEAPVVPTPAPAAVAASPEVAMPVPASQIVEPAATTVESEPPAGIGQSDDRDTAHEIPAAASMAADDHDDREARDDQPEAAPEAPDGPDPVSADSRQDGGEDHGEEEEDDYAIEIRRAATSAEHDHAVAAAGDGDGDGDGDTGADGAGAGEEAHAAARGKTHGRHGRRTNVMTAMEIADVLGQHPVGDGDGDGDADADADAEPDDRQREIRTTNVMTAVEVAEALASGNDLEPAPSEAARGKPRGKRRGRRRR